jgi:hypothetical protein
MPLSIHASGILSLMIANAARLLLVLSGFRALNEFCPQIGIVLSHIQNCLVFVDRQALVGDRLLHSIVGFVDEALLIVGPSLGDALLVVVAYPGDGR